MSDDLVKRLRDLGDHASFDPHMHHVAADRIEELEAQVKEDALQYLSDTGQMGETIGDLTRRHEHALRKIDVLEDQLAKAIEALRITDEWLQELGMYANPEEQLVPSLQKVRDTLNELTGGRDA